MRKTIVYILVLGILGFGVWYFLFSDKQLFSADEAGFKINNIEAIHRIYLANQSGQHISVTRTEDGWMVNDMYKARPGMIDLLLETLKQQEAAYPAPENAHNNIIKGLAGNGIKVELYNKNNDPIRIFYVGGQVAGSAGTYMLIEGAKRPYVVQLPVFQGYVTPRYSVEMEDWRDRTVMNIPASELEKVSVEYPTEELNNFTLQQDAEGTLSVSVHPELMKDKQLNEKRAKDYSGFFEKVYCEGFLNGTLHIDSIIAGTQKNCTIEVLAKDGKKEHIDIYWMPITRRSKNMLTADPDVPDVYDADRLYAVFNNYKDTAIIQRRTFGKLFRKGYEFYEQDTKQ
ncbi:MAG: DUF4340 domain-containing protein [Chitinophagales bacterium]|nr:DUF4340 domain-containing protein [Chitinophagaceae bacterium]MCB9063592.1 DUF4340 domain-containing protein [Chitinophagales bacterium]